MKVLRNSQVNAHFGHRSSQLGGGLLPQTLGEDSSIVVERILEDVREENLRNDVREYKLRNDVNEKSRNGKLRNQSRNGSNDGFGGFGKIGSAGKHRSDRIALVSLTDPSGHSGVSTQTPISDRSAMLNKILPAETVASLAFARLTPNACCLAEYSTIHNTNSIIKVNSKV
jgi:hypothetical protein